MNNIDKLYTSGEFAKKAGVTLRTLRYYDKNNILKPISHTASGYRLYCEDQFIDLQKILTLKYLGFSLEEIKNNFLVNSPKGSLLTSLETQEKILEDKLIHMKSVIKAVKEAKNSLLTEGIMDFNKLINVITTINEENGLLIQYKNSSNLIARINLHDKYSTNKCLWHNWVFDKIKFFPSCKVLELGCGDGSLWLRNLTKIDDRLEITITDKFSGMLKDAEFNLKNTKHNFIFKIAECEKIPFPDESFDIVIANHVLYYIKDRNIAFSEIARILKRGGKLYASTNGLKHLIEIRNITQVFDDRIQIFPKNPAKKFGLENGKSQLEKHFKEVNLFLYNNSLNVTEAEPLAKYIISTYGNARNILNSRYEEFKDYLQKIIDKNEMLYITENSGLFEACKE